MTTSSALPRESKTNVNHIEQARADITFNGKKAIMSLDWEKPSRFYIHVRGTGGLNKVIEEEYDPRNILIAWTKAMKKYKGNLVARTPKHKDLLQKQRQLASSATLRFASRYFEPEFLEAVHAAHLYDIKRKAFKAEVRRADYKAYMQKKMKEWGITTLKELDDAKKKKFFEEVDKGWKSEDEKKGGGDPAYQAYMRKMLKKWGVKSPKELSEEQKPKFFEEVDRGWKSKDEKGGAVQAGLSLSKKDMLVLRAFADQKPAESKKLTTDGVRLDGNWMGGTGIAEWKGGKVHTKDLGSKAAQQVQRALQKYVAKNRFAAVRSAQTPEKGGAVRRGATLPKVGAKIVHKYGNGSTIELKAERVYPTKADADGPLPKNLLRYVGKGGAVVAKRTSQPPPGSTMPDHYVVFFDAQGKQSGAPVSLKPAQYRRVMSYEYSG